MVHLRVWGMKRCSGTRCHLGGARCLVYTEIIRENLGLNRPQHKCLLMVSKS